MLTKIDRRYALGLLAGSALAGAEALTRPLGAQLYTVRREIQEEPEKVLREIAAIGYEEVEVQDAAYPKLRPILNELDLRIRGYRLNPAVVTGSWEAWGAVMKWRPLLGLARRRPSGPPCAFGAHRSRLSGRG